MCSNSLSKPGSTAGRSEDIDLALDNMLRQHHFLFQREADQLTTMQLNFLSALIDGVSRFMAKKNIDQYQLGTFGNITRIKSALENKEIIDTTTTVPSFQDPLFRYWQQKVYFGKGQSVTAPMLAAR